MTTATRTQANTPTYGPVYDLWPAPRQLNAQTLVPPDDDTAAWRRVLERLRSFESLTDDWDGEGSVAPTWPLVESAVVLAQLLQRQGESPPSRVSAGPEGTVLLEWQERNAVGVIYFEYEVCAPDVAEWMLAVPGQPTQHGEVKGWLQYS